MDNATDLNTCRVGLAGGTAGSCIITYSQKAYKRRPARLRTFEEPYPCFPQELMVCLTHGICRNQQHSEDISMADTIHSTSETAFTEQTSQQTFNGENPISEESTGVIELDEEIVDEEIEEELIIEDFTIDGICGVY
jgi:mycofactocin precursor